MLYYSYISKSVVTPAEAHAELFTVLADWFYWAHPNGNFDSYILRHPERLTIESNNICFNKIEGDSVDSIS